MVIVKDGTPCVKWADELKRVYNARSWEWEYKSPQQLNKMSLRQIFKSNSAFLSHFTWEPIWWILDRIGPRSSVQELYDCVREACNSLFVYVPSKRCCVAVRKRWLKANGMQIDCRTYAGQPGRNMIRGRAVKLVA